MSDTNGNSTSESEDLNFVQRARRDKLEALEARGITPFAYGFDRTHLAADAVARQPEGVSDEGETVRVRNSGPDTPITSPMSNRSRAP